MTDDTDQPPKVTAPEPEPPRRVLPGSRNGRPAVGPMMGFILGGITTKGPGNSERLTGRKPTQAERDELMQRRTAKPEKSDGES